MEEMDLKQKDLVGIIGGKSRVSEVLNRKKKLTVEMVRNLAVHLNLSAQILINDYALPGSLSPKTGMSLNNVLYGHCIRLTKIPLSIAGF